MVRYKNVLVMAATAAMLTIGSGAALAAQHAKEYTISVWAGGTGPNDTYRIDAIKIAADLLERGGDQGQ